MSSESRVCIFILFADLRSDASLFISVCAWTSSLSKNLSRYQGKSTSRFNGTLLASATNIRRERKRKKCLSAAECVYICVSLRLSCLRGIKSLAGDGTLAPSNDLQTVLFLPGDSARAGKKLSLSPKATRNHAAYVNFMLRSRNASQWSPALRVVLLTTRRLKNLSCRRARAFWRKALTCAFAGLRVSSGNCAICLFSQGSINFQQHVRVRNAKGLLEKFWNTLAQAQIYEKCEKLKRILCWRQTAD